MSLSSSKVPGQGARFTPRYEGHYLTPEQLDVLRSTLLNWRDDVLNDAQHTIDQMRDDSHFEVGDEGDRAQRETSQTLELRTRDRQRKLLRKIEQALLRIETGDYGYCEDNLRLQTICFKPRLFIMVTCRKIFHQSSSYLAARNAPLLIAM